MKREKNLNRKHHSGREDLAGEHILGDIGQLILLFIFLIVWIGDSFFLHRTTHLSVVIPPFIKILLVIIILFTSGILAKKGLHVVFGVVREKPVVIQEGVFGTVRHPIYLGCILFYLGLLVLSFSIYATLVWFVIIGFYFFLARHEERLLLEKYGDQYETYRKTVPMWLPFIRRRR